MDVIYSIHVDTSLSEMKQICKVDYALLSICLCICYADQRN